MLLATVDDGSILGIAVAIGYLLTEIVCVDSIVTSTLLNVLEILARSLRLRDTDLLTVGWHQTESIVIKGM